LVLQQASTRLSVNIPASTETWVAAEVIREEFYHSIAADEDIAVIQAVDEDAPIDTAAIAEQLQEAQVKLLSKFLAYVNDKVVSSGSTSATDASQLLLSSLEKFNNTFLANKSIHTLTQSYDVEDRSKILAAYYKAFSTLRQVYGKNKVPAVQTSALLEEAKQGKANVYAIFSGQGCNEVS
jgi:fatty acid synthase subunit beta